jgi:4-carboxymuconolactone decarboxylase
MRIILTALGLSLAASGAPAEEKVSDEEIRFVSPALDHYANATVAKLWDRPGLSRRDRSLVTVAALIARNDAHSIPLYAGLALDHGVKPVELSETITHLAFYAGWGNAMYTASAVKNVFATRGIETDQLAKAQVTPLPLDEKIEAQRVETVEKLIGSAVPSLAADTTNVLFRDLWLRPDLAPRDRSLITVSALVTAGRVEQIPFHLNRAMDNGLKREEAAEVISHLAYFAGWPNAFSAAPIVRDVLDKR